MSVVRVNFVKTRRVREAAKAVAADQEQTQQAEVVGREQAAKARFGRDFIERVKDLMIEEVEAGRLAPHEVVVLMAQLIPDLVGKSFNGLNPDEKRENRNNLMTFLNNTCFSKKF